jgi:hypothetical protein
MTTDDYTAAAAAAETFGTFLLEHPTAAGINVVVEAAVAGVDELGIALLAWADVIRQ